jgi:hypothetical protein
LYNNFSIQQNIIKIRIISGVQVNEDPITFEMNNS